MASDRALVLRVRLNLRWHLLLEERVVLTEIIEEPMWEREEMAPDSAANSALSNGKHAGIHISLGRYGRLALDLKYSHLMPI